MEIITIPDQRLRKPTAPVSVFDEEFRTFTEALSAKMYEADGVGLAAIQVADRRSVASIATVDGPLVIVNPVITKRSWSKELGEEGCLSVPGVFGMVKRHTQLTLRYSDITGKPQTLVAKGFFARVIQHEVDHLNGILFIDKVETITQGVLPQRDKT